MGPSRTPRRISAFGSFEVDFASGEVWKHGIRVRIQEQPLRVLAVLIERPGEVVTREELRDRLWATDTFVDFEHSLNAALTRLRQALGDSADNPRFIATHARIGYRFIAAVQFPQAPQELSTHLLAAQSPAEAIGAVSTPQRSNRFGMLAVLCVLLSAGAVWILHSRTPQPPFVLQQLTWDLGLSTEPVVSPDGKLLAYVSDRGEDGRLNIWVRQLVPGGETIQLTHLTADAHQPAFSPDGSRIVFGLGNDKGLFSVPSIGGDPVRLTSFGRDPRFSPDGKWIAFWRGVDVSATVDPSGLVYVMPVTGEPPIQVGPPQSGYPIWAPDSQYLLVARTRCSEVDDDWWVTPISGGPSVRTGAFQSLKQQGFSIELGSMPRPAAWSEGSILFSGRLGPATNLWSIRISMNRVEAPAQRLTSGTAFDGVPSLSADGRIVFASMTEHTGIWSLRLKPNKAQVAGIPERLVNNTGSALTPSITPDGKYLVYTSSAGTSQDVHLKDLQTGKDVAFAATESAEWHPVISRDGSLLAYTNRGSQQGIYIAQREGGSPVKVNDTNTFSWDWSADNRRLLFNMLSKGRQVPEVWSLDVQSQTAKQILHNDGLSLYQAKYSPDDRWIVFMAVPVAHPEFGRVYIVPNPEGSLKPNDAAWIPVVQEPGWADKPRWSLDGNLIYFVSHRDGYRCVWAQALEPASKRPAGPPRAVFHSHTARFSLLNAPSSLAELEIARDRMVLVFGELNANIWSMRPTMPMPGKGVRGGAQSRHHEPPFPWPW